jgi:hypothetical protein
MTQWYEIRLAGRLSPAVVAAFEGMTASERPAETILRGPVCDQAALHGLLDRASDFGLTLIAVRRLSEDDAMARLRDASGIGSAAS